MALQSYAATNMQTAPGRAAAPALTRDAAIARLQRCIARLEAAGLPATTYRAQLAKLEGGK